MGTKVIRKANEPLPIMIRRLNKMMERGGIFRHMREHAHYRKPSEKRREAKNRSDFRAKHPRQPKQPSHHAMR